MRDSYYTDRSSHGHEIENIHQTHADQLKGLVADIFKVRSCQTFDLNTSELFIQYENNNAPTIVRLLVTT